MPARSPPRHAPGPSATTSLFYVDTLEYLRRGGRMGAAAALVGSALAVKPILPDRRRSGRAVRAGAYRGARRCSRLEELAVEAAGSAPVDVAVAHLASPDRASELAQRLGERLAAGLGGARCPSGRSGGARRARRAGHGRGLRRPTLSTSSRGPGFSTGTDRPGGPRRPAFLASAHAQAVSRPGRRGGSAPAGAAR